MEKNRVETLQPQAGNPVIHRARAVKSRSSSRSWRDYTLVVAGILLTAATAARAYEVPTTPSGSWTGSGLTTGNVGTTAASSGTFSKTTPSGVTVRVTTNGVFSGGVSSGPSGSYFTGATQTGTGGLNPTAAGTSPGAFTTNPVMPPTINAVQLLTSFAPCQTSSPSLTTCNNFGTVVVNFVDASGTAVRVSNPRIHVSRLGGTVSSGTIMELSTGLRINAAGSTPGVSFSATAPAAQTDTLVITGTEFYGDPNAPTASLNVNCGASATQTAGCGSVQVNGEVSTLTLDLVGRRTTAGPNAWGTAGDSYWFDVSFDEDYGGAPTSYEGYPWVRNNYVISDC